MCIVRTWAVCREVTSLKPELTNMRYFDSPVFPRTSMHHIRWWQIHHDFNNLWRQLCGGRWCICGELLLIFPQPPINLHSATSHRGQWCRSVYLWLPGCRGPVIARGPHYCAWYIDCFCNWQFWPAGHSSIIYQHCALMKSVLRNGLYYCSYL